MKHNLIFIILTFLFAVVPQVWGANHVLSLDGDGDYVRLPSDIFNELEEATIEGWIRCEKFNPNSWSSAWFSDLFFDFGEWNKSMLVLRPRNKPDLEFRIYDEEGKQHRCTAKGILSKGRWYHIAVVSSKEGMKLYANGILMEENPYEGSFSRIGSGANNYLGLSNWEPSQFLHGQMDEVRVWSVARTEGQIRDTMFRALHGDEPGLVGYWQFEKESEKAIDSTKNGYDGEMVGDAKLVAMELPINPEQLVSDILTVKAKKQPDFKTGELKLEITAHRFPKVAGLIPLPTTIEIYDNANQLLLKEAHAEGEILIWPVPDDFEGDVRIVVQQTDAVGNERTSEMIASTRRFGAGKQTGGSMKDKVGLFRNYDYIDGLCSNRIWRVLEADDGALWIGTFGGGVSRFDGQTWQTFTTDDGRALLL